MKFIINTEEAKRKEIHVFDKDTQKVIAVFKYGEFETKEDPVIKKLVELGYTKETKKNA